MGGAPGLFPYVRRLTPRPPSTPLPTADDATRSSRGLVSPPRTLASRLLAVRLPGAASWAPAGRRRARDAHVKPEIPSVRVAPVASATAAASPVPDEHRVVEIHNGSVPGEVLR